MRGSSRLATIVSTVAFFVASVVPLLASCAVEDDCAEAPLCGPVVVPSAAPAKLSALRLFGWDAERGFRYNDRVVPYELNTPLFSDYALKERAIYVPEGSAARFVSNGVLDFPVGTVIVKTFYFPADLREPTRDLALVETRVLIRRESAWEAWPYVWDEDQRDATLTPAAPTRVIDFVDESGTARTASYLIPSRNQCVACHVRTEVEDVITPIGPSARNLHRSHDYGGDVGPRDQLAYLEELGMLTGLPALESVDAAFDFERVHEGALPSDPDELDAAARSYLDVNCGHCHSPAHRNGVTSQLFLTYDNQDRFRLGVCKRPGSAGAGTFGLDYDVVPGDAERSILYRRLATEEVGAMMPLLGRSLAHDRGAALIQAWIDAMPSEDCE